MVHTSRNLGRITVDSARETSIVEDSMLMKLSASQWLVEKTALICIQYGRLY